MQSILQYRRLQKQHKQQSTGGQQTSQSRSKALHSPLSRGEDASVNGAGSPLEPREWPVSRKIVYSILLFNLVFVTGWASASDSATLVRSSARYHVSHVSDTLTTALYLFAVAFGAMISGPVSEITGRNPLYFLPGLLYLLALVGVAAAPTYGARIVMRLFAGFFASPAMTNFGGSLADMWTVSDRGLVWPLFSLGPLLGPSLAPVAGGWIEQSRQSWHWVDWVVLIISGIAFGLAFLFLPETYLPKLNSWQMDVSQRSSDGKSQRAEDDARKSLVDSLQKQFHGILIHLTREPITILFGLYLTLLYVLVYTFLHGFSYVYGRTYGWSSGLIGSSFAAVAIGVILGVVWVLAVNRVQLSRLRREAKTCSDNDTQGSPLPKHDDETEIRPPPESRLVPAVPVAILLPASLFWLGFTDRRSISYWSPLAACFLFGFSLSGLFTPMYHYVIDSYGTRSASAMAAVTFMRYSASGGMVIAAIPMYNALGVQWTMVLLGIVASLLVPVPALFWWKGQSIRSRSRFAWKDDLIGNQQ